MADPEKLATYGTQDEDKQSKKHNRICVGHHYMQTKRQHNMCSIHKQTQIT